VFASLVTSTVRFEVVPVFAGDSLDSQRYVVIADPPFAGVVHVTVSLSTPAVAVGAAIVAGTVVIRTAAVAAEDADVPAAFDAVAVKV
jgi:hypothetical protein